MNKKVAITGIMGAGKSTLGSLIKKRLDFPVFCADAIIDAKLKSSKKLLERLISITGPGCINKDGTLNKKMVAKLVFNDKKKLALVESLLHPLVIDEIKTIRHKAPLLFFEIPLLFEKNLQGYFHSVITVACHKQTIEKRLSKRMAKKEISKRLQFQFSQEQKILLSQFTVWNTHSKEDLFKSFLQLLTILS